MKLKTEANFEYLNYLVALFAVLSFFLATLVVLTATGWPKWQ